MVMLADRVQWVAASIPECRRMQKLHLIMQRTKYPRTGRNRPCCDEWVLVRGRQGRLVSGQPPLIERDQIGMEPAQWLTAVTRLTSPCIGEWIMCCRSLWHGSFTPSAMY